MDTLAASGFNAALKGASLAVYEDYRQKIQHDAACQAAFAYARQTACIRRYERSFFRPASV